MGGGGGNGESAVSSAISSSFGSPPLRQQQQSAMGKAVGEDGPSLIELKVGLSPGDSNALVPSNVQLQRATVCRFYLLICTCGELSRHHHIGEIP